MSNPEEQFRQAMSDSGLIPPEVLIADGNIHRCDVEGRNGTGDGAYQLHLDGCPNGGYQNWKDGEGWQKWKTPLKVALQGIRNTIRKKVLPALHSLVDVKAKHASAKKKAQEIWDRAEKCVGHPYLKGKGVSPHGLRNLGKTLVIPIRDGEGKIQSLQFIDQDGEKRFLAGGQKKNGYHSIGKVAGKAILVSEGYATGATLFEATGLPTVVAFDSGNLPPVCRVIRDKFPQIPIMVCGDDDWMTPGNPGKSEATKAATDVEGLIAFPEFPNPRPATATDFNDLASMEGIQVVARLIERALADRLPEGSVLKGFPSFAIAGNQWRTPRPFLTSYTESPYPVDALPPIAQKAVIEASMYLKAPIPIVASSALSIISLAIQGLVDVRRDEVLEGPTGIFLLTIAQSGDRKTAADSLLSTPITDYERKVVQEMSQEIQQYRAQKDAWDSAITGAKAEIAKLMRNQEDTSTFEQLLKRLYESEPKRPRIPKLRREDSTPEGLAKLLQDSWPSAGILSNEAGIVFGSQGMSRDSIMRSMGLVARIWDGGIFRSDRADTERSREVHGARLTVGLLIQETTLKAFFKNDNGLSRGSGFLARFLVCRPSTLMGTRFYEPPPPGLPSVRAFKTRITELLETPLPMAADWTLTPKVLCLSSHAKDSWILHHDAVEAEMAQGGFYEEVRDVASKNAEIAARLAALFHVFEHGSEGEIGLTTFEGASRVARWYLDESRRFFQEVPSKPHRGLAEDLNDWLVKYCRENDVSQISKSKVQQFGPSRLRRKPALDPILRELEGLDRVRIERCGSSERILVNPALLSPEAQQTVSRRESQDN